MPRKKPRPPSTTRIALAGVVSFLAMAAFPFFLVRLLGWISGRTAKVPFESLRDAGLLGGSLFCAGIWIYNLPWIRMQSHAAPELREQLWLCRLPAREFLVRYMLAPARIGVTLIALSTAWMALVSPENRIGEMGPIWYAAPLLAGLVAIPAGFDQCRIGFRHASSGALREFLQTIHFLVTMGLTLGAFSAFVLPWHPDRSWIVVALVVIAFVFWMASEADFEMDRAAAEFYRFEPSDPRDPPSLPPPSLEGRAGGLRFIAIWTAALVLPALWLIPTSPSHGFLRMGWNWMNENGCLPLLPGFAIGVAQGRLLARHGIGWKLWALGTAAAWWLAATLREGPLEIWLEWWQAWSMWPVPFWEMPARLRVQIPLPLMTAESPLRVLLAAPLDTLIAEIVAGAIQTFVLLRSSPRAWRWAPWAAGAFVAGRIATCLVVTPGWPLPLGAVARVDLALCVGWVVTGATSGWGMLRFLRTETAGSDRGRLGRARVPRPRAE